MRFETGRLPVRERQWPGPMTQTLPLEDAKRLIKLCQTGRLYDVERWIGSGKSTKTPPELRTSPLRVALDTEFHSLIELLLRHEVNQRVKNEVLAQAVDMRRLDFVELAVEYGADTASLPLIDVLLSWDRGIMSLFLKRGADPIGGHPFAHAFQKRIRTALGCYLDCKRAHPELSAHLQEQADIALRQFSRDGNLKWVSLLMWAGANPRSRGPTLEDLEYIDEADGEDMSTTALEEACTFGHLEILERLVKPDPSLDGRQLRDLLSAASTFANGDIITYLLSRGAKPNDRADGGSTALNACIRNLGWEDIGVVLYGRLTPSHKVSKTRGALCLLLEHGAVWKPGESLKEIRRALYRLQPAVIVELVGLLLKHHACDEGTTHDLLRTPRMRKHMKGCEDELSRLGLTVDGRRRPQSHEVKPSSTSPGRAKARSWLPPSPYLLHKYDREQLYEELWAEPTRTVAARYGITDVGLAKVCHQLRVPKPPRGYWAKKAAGRPVPRRPKLPRLEDGRTA